MSMGKRPPTAPAPGVPWQRERNTGLGAVGGGDAPHPTVRVFVSSFVFQGVCVCFEPERAWLCASELFEFGVLAWKSQTRLRQLSGVLLP